MLRLPSFSQGFPIVSLSDWAHVLSSEDLKSCLLDFGPIGEGGLSCASPLALLRPCSGHALRFAPDKYRGTTVEGRVSTGRFLATRHSSLFRYGLKALTLYKRCCCPG